MEVTASALFTNKLETTPHKIPYIVHVGQYRSFNAEMLYLGLVAIAMVAQLVRAFVSHAKDQMFESRSPPT